MKRVAVSSLLLAAVACGPKPGPDEAGDGVATVVLPDVPFDQLDHDQKIAFMKQVVMPKMGPIFQRHDRQQYAEFGCKTCHGPGADEGEFHMPNDELPKLNFADLSKFEQRDVEWMKATVKPTMAQLLQAPELTPDNPDGFGCLDCHVQIGQ